MSSRTLPIRMAWISILAAAFSLTELGGAGRLDTAFLRDRVAPELGRVNAFFTDLKYRLRGPRAPRNRIVIVDVDDEALRQQGRWPWPRDRQAYLLERVFASRPRVVGVDVLWSEPETKVPESIVEHLKRAGEERLLAEAAADESLLIDVVRRHRKDLVLAWAIERPCVPAHGGCDEVEESRLAGLPARFALFRPASEAAVARPRITSAARIIPSLPDYGSASQHQGFANHETGRDGIARRAMLVAQVADRLHPSLAVAMARNGMGDELAAERRADGSLASLRWTIARREIPANPLGLAEIDYRGPGGTFIHVPATEVLGEGDRLRYRIGGGLGTATRAELFRDAYVLVGVTALSVGDVKPSPFDEQMSGVETQATVLDNVLANDFLRAGGAAPWTLFALMTVGAGLAAAGLGRLRAAPAIAVAAAALLALAAVDVTLFSRAAIDPHTGFLYLELIGLILLHLGAKYVEEENGRRYIRYAFSRYLSPAVVDQIARDPELLKMGGTKRDLTILFSDIRGFTTFSEAMDAKLLGEFLNAYLDRMTDIVFDTGGTLDKYIGDALMAFWGAPVRLGNHALAACVAARRMMETLEAERPRLKAKYGVDVQIGIGINSGAVSVGNMGSSKSLGYTVIGDAVNLASRLEGATKAYGVSILTTRATLDAIEADGGKLPAHRVLDRLKVKGKDVAVEIVQILDRDPDPAGLALFQEGRRHYAERRWDEAIDAFRRAAALLGADGRGDAPCEMFIERCAEFRAHPPQEGWDGSWKMETK